MAETLHADGVAANNGCVDPANAQGAADNTWTGNTGSTSWDARWSMANPSGPLIAGTQTVTVRVRRSATGGSGQPTVAVELWEAGSSVGQLGDTYALGNSVEEHDVVRTFNG
jgi:hypothetical protein